MTTYADGRQPGDLSPFTDEVLAIAAHHGVPIESLDVPRLQGQANLTVFLGSDLVLRIPRTRKASTLLAKEAEVIPLVQDAGVPTSSIVDHDESLQIAGVPYLILERLHGETWAESGIIDRRAYESLGEILVTLHQIRPDVVRDTAAIPGPFTFSPDEVVQELRDAGEIGTAQADWLLGQFERLLPHDRPQPELVLVHRDVTSSNVIMDQHGSAVALIDWGCAEWGMPARDLVGLPIQALPDLISGYRAALRPRKPDRPNTDLEREALWLHLYLALARLMKAPSTSEDRNWAAPRQATLLNILAFYSDAVPISWPGLLHDRVQSRQSGRPF